MYNTVNIWTGIIQYIFKKGNVNECYTALVKNLIKKSFYGKRKKSH